MIVIGSHNGQLATTRAYELLVAGRSPLDACVEGVSLVEDDPEELTVGYGGLPNEEGLVELDAAVMDGRTHRGAGVAGLRNIRHVTRLAKLVLEQTNRVLLVGEGALNFARANGFPEEDLLTEKARRMWLYWKRRRSAVDDWQPPADDDELDLERWFQKHFYAAKDSKLHGTVHCAALDGASNLAAATSTSGHAFKIPGRVGDSPILGAGLYVDNQAGSCGSIGHGEANLENLSSFLAVQKMCDGARPEEAGLEALRRVAETCHPHERDEQGRPKFNLQMFLLAKDGSYAGVSMWPRRQFVVSDQRGTRMENCTPLH